MPLVTDIHDRFVLPNARFNPTARPPSCSGLLTPPESPISGHTPPLPVSTNYPSSSAQEGRGMPQLPRFGAFEPAPQNAPPHPPPQDLSRVSETIYTIIEQVIEQKLAEAMGPLRLNIRRFDSENTDLQTQNDTLGSQVRCLEAQVNAQLQTLQTLQNISFASSSNLEIISALANKLSDATNSMERARDFNHHHQPPTSTSPLSHQHENHCNIHPQFCFERRSSKRQRRSYTKSRKSSLVNCMLSKWRTGGARE